MRLNIRRILNNLLNMSRRVIVLFVVRVKVFVWRMLVVMFLLVWLCRPGFFALLMTCVILRLRSARMLLILLMVRLFVSLRVFVFVIVCVVLTRVRRRGRLRLRLVSVKLCCGRSW